jgi:DNA-binding transcriptional ArsR family regulator
MGEREERARRADPAGTAKSDLDRTLVALADPTRRAILHRLATGPARVTELAAPFDISLNSVSKHIRILERAHLVRRRRQGREHILSFDAAPLHEAAEWIARQRAFWTTRLDALEAALRAEDRAAAHHSERRARRA